MDLFLITGSVFLGAFAAQSIYETEHEYDKYRKKYANHPEKLLHLLTRQKRDGTIDESSVDTDMRPQQYPYLDGGVYYGNTDPCHAVGIEDIHHEPYSLNGYTKEIVINNGTRYVNRGVNPQRYKKKHHKVHH
jgi:hypothetical protein